MREQPAGDRRDRSAEAERADLDRGGVEADETGGGFVIAHRANLEPDLRALEHHDQHEHRIAQIQM